MLNSIPVLGWVLDFIFRASMAIPFWFIWTFCGIGAKFFYFLPQVYQSPGFWETVGVFIVIGILKALLIPKLATVSNDQKVGSSN
jgi:hypothetical protein